MLGARHAKPPNPAKRGRRTVAANRAKEVRVSILGTRVVRTEDPAC